MLQVSAVFAFTTDAFSYHEFILSASWEPGDGSEASRPPTVKEGTVKYTKCSLVSATGRYLNRDEDDAH